MRTLGSIRRCKVSLWLLIASLYSVTIQASHIIGGDVSMKAVGNTPGLFRLQLNQYWDETQTVASTPTSAGNRDASVTLLIYRKQNPVLIERITLLLQETIPLTFDNAACATLQQLSFTQASYYTTYQFTPSRYTDSGGYYMVWERCCRNNALTNVDASVADGVAMTFYLEFPAMQKNGTTFQNSSPDFRLPNGSYICINKPFTFSADATDADGDQLRYSLVTPLNGYTTRNNPSSTSDAPRASYPTINWGPGYSLSNIIPGNPPLTINQTSGQLSLRATQEGLFLFTVQCEEFRNGERIGVVRRDFQFPVIDCSKNTPPAAVVMANGQPASDLTWCANQPLILSVEKNASWAYQWQKDGTNLRGSTSDTLRVVESGTYTVVKSLANVCSNDTTSEAVNITVVTATPVSLSLVGNQPYCTGDTLTIQTENTPNTQYKWLRDGVTLAGQQQSSIRVYESGLYTLQTESETAACGGLDSINVIINQRPTVQINSSARVFCPDASVQLVAVSNQNGGQYVWQQDNTRLTATGPQLEIQQPGTYRVTITAPNGCTALSDTVRINQYAATLVLIDSIAPVCSTDSTLLTLQAQPPGGTFAGIGVQGTQFNPIVAGAGHHQITYTITTAQGCQIEQTRWIDVINGPEISGQTSYAVVKGNSVELSTHTNGLVSQYQWEPPESLSAANAASPWAAPTVTTTYRLTATDASGCISVFSVLVEVLEPLFIPTAFSPNADGVNDSWVIPNIQSFPNCEVSIYNRWGELVFYSKGYAQPWDGRYRGDLVNTGIYTYQIRTGISTLATTYRGQLSIIR